jgi:hypothetical protein
MAKKKPVAKKATANPKRNRATVAKAAEILARPLPVPVPSLGRRIGSTVINLYRKVFSE